MAPEPATFLHSAEGTVSMQGISTDWAQTGHGQQALDSKATDKECADTAPRGKGCDYLDVRSLLRFHAQFASKGGGGV